MKITHTILALMAAGFLGQSAFGSDNNGWSSRLSLAITQDGHGGSRFQYYQTAMPGTSMSVALSTETGGVAAPMPLANRTGAQPDNGQTKFVVGTNGHGQSNTAYIPMTSHFAQAGQ